MYMQPESTIHVYTCIYSTDQMQGVIYLVCTRRQTHLYTEANTCLYSLYNETNAFTREGKHVCLILYLASDLYCTCTLLAHIKISDRNEIWAWDLYHSTALVKAAKSLVLSNVKGQDLLIVSFSSVLLENYMREGGSLLLFIILTIKKLSYIHE